VPAAVDYSIVDRVVTATRSLGVAGEQDLVWGHAAIRDPDGRGVWMKASGWGFDEITAERIQLVGWDGGVLEGTGKAHIESHIHLSVMRARSDVNASVHTHSPAVNAFSALQVPLRALSHDGVLFDEPQIPRSPLSGDLISDAERGSLLAKSLGDHLACLMPRHGLVTAGPTEAHAVMYAVLLSSACRTMLSALDAGEVRSWSDASELADKKRHVWPDSQIVAGYDYLVRRSLAV
jgi:ribulose-5-phosphate 4-epimerase/fuculose-1-phosphate aldolase